MVITGTIDLVARMDHYNKHHTKQYTHTCTQHTQQMMASSYLPSPGLGHTSQGSAPQAAALVQQHEAFVISPDLGSVQRPY